MVARKGFDSTVAARTRAAQQILSTPELLAAYVALGGLAADLQAIVAAGRDAEISNHAQGSARSDGKSATAEVLRSFDALQRDYSLVMAVVRAVRAAVARANPDDALLTRLDDIIANTAEACWHRDSRGEEAARAPSTSQLTPHLHLLVPEALWTEEGEVVTLPPPDDAQVTALLWASASWRYMAERKRWPSAASVGCVASASSNFLTPCALHPASRMRPDS